MPLGFVKNIPLIKSCIIKRYPHQKQYLACYPLADVKRLMNQMALFEDRLSINDNITKASYLPLIDSKSIRAIKNVIFQ